MAAASQRESPFPEAGRSGAEVAVGDAGTLAPAQCPICMEELVADGGVTVLPGCSHAFHSSCIREWFNRAPTPTCPSCRRGMRKQRAYMNALAAIESHERSVTEEAAALRVRRLRRERRRADLLGVRARRRVATSEAPWQRLQDALAGLELVLALRDDAPLFRFDPAN